MQTVTTFHFYVSGDLRGYQERGSKARAYCPVHGGDKQKSLSIDLEGDFEGFGQCFNCQERVLVVDLNPDAARRLGYDKDIPGRRSSSKQAVQQEWWQPIELQLLQAYVPHMRNALLYDRPRAYLAQRGIPFELANEMGLLYLPIVSQKEHKGCLFDSKREPTIALRGALSSCTACRLNFLRKWQDRILYPLVSSEGIGFAGRTLRLWELGMNENEHKAKLREHNNKDYKHEIRHTEKTNPAGYFNYNVVKSCEHLTLVEGAFDALALLAGGVSDVIALCGTSIDAKAVPIRIHRVLIALDGDDAGHKATRKLRKELWQHGIEVDYCSIPDDKKGKDWSERYRLHGRDGLTLLFPTTASRTSVVDDNPPNASSDDEVVICSVCGYEVEMYSPHGQPYCFACYGKLQEHQGSIEAYANAVASVASVFGSCTVYQDPPEYTLADRVREIIAERDQYDLRIEQEKQERYTSMRVKKLKNFG